MKEEMPVWVGNGPRKVGKQDPSAESRAKFKQSLIERIILNSVQKSVQKYAIDASTTIMNLSRNSRGLEDFYYVSLLIKIVDLIRCPQFNL